MESEEEQFEKRLSYVGKKIKNLETGKKGVICGYIKRDDTFSIQFKDEIYWYPYPAEQVIENINNKKKDELIGYKLKEEYKWMDKSLYKIFINVRPRGRFTETSFDDKFHMSANSPTAKEMKRLGILDELFDKVYEEPKLLGYRLKEEHKDLDLVISKWLWGDLPGWLIEYFEKDSYIYKKLKSAGLLEKYFEEVYE